MIVATGSAAASGTAVDVRLLSLRPAGMFSNVNEVVEQVRRADQGGRVGQGKTLDKFGLTTDGLLPIVERVIGYPLLGRSGLGAFA